MGERWEGKIFKTIYGGVNTDEGWGRRTNKKIETVQKITAVANNQRINGWDMYRDWSGVECLKWFYTESQ